MWINCSTLQVEISDTASQSCVTKNKSLLCSLLANAIREIWRFDLAMTTGGFLKFAGTDTGSGLLSLCTGSPWVPRIPNATGLTCLNCHRHRGLMYADRRPLLRNGPPRLIEQ